MTDLERLDEALELYDDWMNGVSMMVEDFVHDLSDAARAYLVANAERVEPDYEAAFRARWDEEIRFEMTQTEFEVEMESVRLVVDAAVGGRLLVSGGERVEWCEEHKSELDREEPERGRCDWADGRSGCRIVSRLLVDPPKEEER